MIELDAVVIGDFRLEDFEWPIDSAARQPQQGNAGESESFGNAGFGQLRELLERVDAPAIQDFDHFIGQGESRDIQSTQLWVNRHAGKIAGGQDGCFWSFSDGYVDGVAGAEFDGARDLSGRAR